MARAALAGDVGSLMFIVGRSDSGGYVLGTDFTTAFVHKFRNAGHPEWNEGSDAVNAYFWHALASKLYLEPFTKFLTRASEIRPSERQKWEALIVRLSNSTKVGETLKRLRSRLSPEKLTIIDDRIAEIVQAHRKKGGDLYFPGPKNHKISFREETADLEKKSATVFPPR